MNKTALTLNAVVTALIIYQLLTGTAAQHPWELSGAAFCTFASMTLLYIQALNRRRDLP